MWSVSSRDVARTLGKSRGLDHGITARGETFSEGLLKAMAVPWIFHKIVIYLLVHGDCARCKIVETLAGFQGIRDKRTHSREVQSALSNILRDIENHNSPDR